MAVYYGLAKGTYDSIKYDWDTFKKEQFAYIICKGLSNGTFFLQHAGLYNSNYPYDSLFEDKNDAVQKGYDIRRIVNEERRRCCPCYTKYHDRVFVHEFIRHSKYDVAFLPTVNEIKQGIEYMKANADKKDDYAKWLDGNKDKSPKQVREELISQYMNR